MNERANHALKKSMKIQTTIKMSIKKIQNLLRLAVKNSMRIIKTGAKNSKNNGERPTQKKQKIVQKTGKITI